MKHNGPNEPAFPRPCGKASDAEQNLEQDGMTMREWYAGMALPVVAAMLAEAGRQGTNFSKDGVEIEALTEDHMAAMAFGIADAMLRRAKEES